MSSEKNDLNQFMIFLFDVKNRQIMKNQENNRNLAQFMQSVAGKT